MATNENGLEEITDMHVEVEDPGNATPREMLNIVQRASLILKRVGLDGFVDASTHRRQDAVHEVLGILEDVGGLPGTERGLESHIERMRDALAAAGSSEETYSIMVDALNEARADLRDATGRSRNDSQDDMCHMIVEEMMDTGFSMCGPGDLDDLADAIEGIRDVRVADVRDAEQASDNRHFIDIKLDDHVRSGKVLSELSSHFFRPESIRAPGRGELVIQAKSLPA